MANPKEESSNCFSMCQMSSASVVPHHLPLPLLFPLPVPLPLPARLKDPRLCGFANVEIGSVCEISRRPPTLRAQSSRRCRPQSRIHLGPGWQTGTDKTCSLLFKWSWIQFSNRFGSSIVPFRFLPFQSLRSPFDAVVCIGL
jgi:hypothetical protein